MTRQDNETGQDITVKIASVSRIFVPSLAAAALLAVAASTAHAGWTVTNLHPAGATWSEATGAHGDHQVGRAHNGTWRASLWRGTAESWVSLRPVGATESVSNGAFGHVQVGSAQFGGAWRAGRWTGSAASWVNLHPPEATESIALGVSGDVQAGHVIIGGVRRAGMWSGTAASFVDLHPAGATESMAFATSAGRQVGIADIGGTWRASLWRGTAASWVDLHPAGASSSEARGASGARQVGSADIGGATRAGMWRGTAASWVDLHPAGAVWSEARGISGGVQVGRAQIGGMQRASLWRDTAASWVDLHALLPGGPGAWGESRADGVWTDGITIRVVGRGIHRARPRWEALLWTWAPPRVSGTLGLSGWAAPLAGRRITFEVRAPGSIVPLQTAVAELWADGGFTFGTWLPAGTYDVTAKGDRWLRARLQNVTFTAAGASGLAFGELLPGDVVEDNAVDLSDFLALASTYEASPPTVPTADLNGDGAVELADFLLLAANYETVGSP
jgi:hypothetical protein